MRESNSDLSALGGSPLPGFLWPFYSGSLALYQEGHFNSVGERKRVQVSARAPLSAQSRKSVEQSRSYCCFNLSCLPRKGSAGF